MNPTRDTSIDSRGGLQTSRNTATGSRSVSGPARISTPSRPRQSSNADPSDRSAPSTSKDAGPSRAKKSSPPGPSRLRAQPYTIQTRMQSASTVLASTSLVTLLSIAKQQSPAQVRRHAEHEVLGLDGDLACPPPEWPTDWAADPEDDKRLAIGMKGSGRKARDKMRNFARKAELEARARVEAVERRHETMIESATGDGVSLAIKADIKDEARNTPRALSRRAEALQDSVMEIKTEETVGSANRRRDSPANSKGKARRTVVISDSDDDDKTELDAEGDVDMLDADAVKRRIKGTFSNRRSLGKKRGV